MKGFVAGIIFTLVTEGVIGAAVIVHTLTNETKEEEE